MSVKYYPVYVFNAALTIYNMCLRMENKLKQQQYGVVYKLKSFSINGSHLFLSIKRKKKKSDITND